MKPIALYIVPFLLIFNAFSEETAQKTTTISKAKISFEFVSKEVSGTIEGFQSKSKIDWEHLEDSYFEGSVSVKTLDTNNGLRNWSLKGGKYFDEDEYPRIHFKSNEVVLNGNTLNVKGTLTLKGTSKPVKIVFTIDDNRLVGRTQLHTSDFGINIKKKREDNLVKVKLQFEFN